MSRNRAMPPRWPARLAALLFLALLAGWLSWTPYHPERADTAIPADARWVSWHRAPGERWADLTCNPLVADLLADVLGPDAAREAAGRPLPPALHRLIADRVVLAQVTMDPRTGRTAWFGSAWSGTRGRWLRWQLKLFRPAGVERYGWHGGRPLYRLGLAGLPAGQRLSLTFEEGLVLACLSEDPHDIRRMLDAHDGLVPSLRDRGMKPDPVAPDEILVRRTEGLNADLRLRFSHLGPDRTEAHLRIGPGGASRGGAPHPALPPLPWGTIPEATAVFPTDLLWRLPLPDNLAFLLPELRRAIDSLGEPPLVAVGLFGLPFTGRYRGMRVPGLVLALRTDAPVAQVDAAVDRLLDRLNAERRWGLIPAIAPESRTPFRRVMGSEPNAFGALPRTEVPAYALVPGYLLIASNAETLQQLLEANAEPAPIQGMPEPGEDLGLRFELDRAASTLRLAFGVYQLYQVMERREPGPTERALAQTLGRRLSDIERLGVIEMGLRLEPGAFEARFRARHPEPADPPCTDSST